MTSAIITDARGGIAVVSALSLSALLVAAGVAVDYSTLQSARAKLQNSCDATALAAAAAHAGGNKKFDSSGVFAANLKGSGIVVEPSIKQLNDRAECSVSYAHKNAFGGLVGIDVTELKIKSVARGFSIASPSTLKVKLDRIGSEAWNRNQIFFFTFTPPFNPNRIESKTLVAENKDVDVYAPTGTATIQKYEGKEFTFPVPPGQEFGFSLESFGEDGVRHAYYSPNNPEHLIADQGSCYDDSIRHRWEDSIGPGSTAIDYNDMEYSISCGYDLGAANKSGSVLLE